MFIHRFYFLVIVEMLFGAALILNCALSLTRREGMYDERNTRYTTLSMWAGMLVGMALFLHAWLLMRMITGAMD